MRFRTIKQLRISNKITFFKRYQLTLYRYNSDIVSGILFDIIWHIVWHSIWNSFWHIIWNYVLHFIWHIFWHSVRQSIFHWHSIWHSPWHVFGPMRAQLHPEIAIGFGSRHAPDQCVPRLNLSFGWESGWHLLWAPGPLVPTVTTSWQREKMRRRGGGEEESVRGRSCTFVKN